MQREAPLTPKSKRSNRPAPVTPNRSQSASMESLIAPRARAHGHRTTMAPSDFAVPGLFGKKRIPSSRQSIMPTSQYQSLLDTTRRPEPEYKDTEMKLMYDKCLQTLMVETLLNKKLDDNEKAMVSQLGMLMKEEDALEDKLLFMTGKKNDLTSLMNLQNFLDTNFAEITASLDKFDGKPMEILLLMKSMFESLDTIKCKNMIIPKTSEEMQKIDEHFAKCSLLTQFVNDCIGSRGESLRTVNLELKEFVGTHQELEHLAKKTKEALNDLQVLMLKDAARTVSLNKS